MDEKTSSSDTWMVLLFVIVIICVFGPVVWDHFRRGNVIKNGVPATAKIVSISDTGRRLNTNPVVRIELVVTDVNGKDYGAEVTMPVSPVRLPQFQPGAAVRVKYDPSAPERVAIDGQEAGGQQ